jgi:hypothetical protein
VLDYLANFLAAFDMHGNPVDSSQVFLSKKASLSVIGKMATADMQPYAVFRIALAASAGLTLAWKHNNQLFVNHI